MKLDQQDLLVLKDHQVQEERLVLQVRPELLDQEVKLDQQDLQDLQAPLVQEDLLETLVHLVQGGIQDQQVQEENLVLVVKMVNQVAQVQLDLLVQQDPSAKLGHQDHLAHLDHLDLLDQEARLEKEDRMDHQAQLVKNNMVLC